MDRTAIDALYRYNAWANDRVLEEVSTVSPADFVRDLRSSYGSLRDTLTHIVWAEWIWLERWRGLSPSQVFSPDEFPDVSVLREAFSRIEVERSAFLKQLPASRLVEHVTYQNMKGETWSYPLWQQLHHVVNHSTYHRGQVTTLMRQLGGNPKPLDLLVYYDEGGS